MTDCVTDPVQDFLPCLKDHLLGRLRGLIYNGNKYDFNDEDRHCVIILNNKIYKHTYLQAHISTSMCIYDSITQCMTCGRTKIQSTPIPTPTSCYCQKKTSAYIHIGKLTSVSSSIPWYNIATTLHLCIQSLNRWTSYSCDGSDVTQTSALDGMPSDYLSFNSSTKKI